MMLLATACLLGSMYAAPTMNASAQEMQTPLLEETANDMEADILLEEAEEFVDGNYCYSWIFSCKLWTEKWPGANY